MGLKYEVADIRELLQGVVDVRGSASYQAVLEEGREEGEERGRLKAALRILVNSGTKKHGEPSKKVHQRLSTVSDPELLEQLAAEIRDMASWDELIARLD